MGTVLASTIISKAQIVLNDVDGVRWTSDELIGWLCDGQREIVIHKPNAYVKNENMQLVAGTLQSLPDDGVQLIDVVKNSTGRVIRITGRETLDAANPNWHTSTASKVVKHYMYSMLDSKHFWVYPPQPTSSPGIVKLIYCANPPDITSDDAISVDDIYQTALLDYVLYRAFNKDTEFAPDTNRAATHYGAFMASLGGKAKVEVSVSPNAVAPATSSLQPIAS
jgi:hypothetical protein